MVYNQAAAFEMVCVVTVDLVCKEGSRKQLLADFKKMLPDTRARDGFISIEVNIDQDKPDRIFAYEHWENRASYEAYIAWREERGDMDVIKEAVAEPPKFSFFDPSP